jgi:PmbA protein
MSIPAEIRAEVDALSSLAREVVQRACGAGADQAEVGLSVEQGLSVNVRLGEVETIENTFDRGLSLTVYIDQRKGQASSADLSPDSIQATLEQAIAIARFTQADACHGLADAQHMASVRRDLQQWFPHALSPEAAIAIGQACEAEGLARDTRIVNSEGASVSSNRSYGVYANSHGFCGDEASTSYSISASFVADAGDGAMERDYDYDSSRDWLALRDAKAIGLLAADKTLQRLQPRQLSTRRAKVVLSAEIARGMVGHLVSAVSGGAQYRKSSFLLGSVGQALLPSWCQWIERPHLARAFGSADFDAEGVATMERPLIEDGKLARYVLGSYSARRLGLSTTANAGGLHNLVVASNAGDITELLQEMHTGLYVTELMGQGVNTTTGDYSRGAAGFWVEAGKICYPVSEITIAGQLRDMYAGLIAIASDVDFRGGIHCGSMLLSDMTIAGS